MVTGRLPEETQVGSVAKYVLLILFAIVLTASVGWVLMYDHPAAQVGFGKTDASSFSQFEDNNKTYSVVAEYTIFEGKRKTTHVRYPNGSKVTEVETIDSVSEGDEVIHSTTVRAEEVRYEAERYNEEYDPEIIGPDVYYDSSRNVVYSREKYNKSDNTNPGYNPDIRLGYILSDFSYTKNGSQRWVGTSYTRYDILDTRDFIELFTRAEVGNGYVLVNNDGEIRYAELKSADGSQVLVYETHAEVLRAFPSWITEIEEKFSKEPRHRNIHAYDMGSHLLLTGSAQWIPSENITVALIERDDEMEKYQIKEGERVFRRVNGNYVSYLDDTGNGISLVQNSARVSKNESIGIESENVYPKPEIIFDRHGINVYEVAVEPKSSLIWMRSAIAAHLLPRNGGGRVLRVDDLKLGNTFSSNASISITVGNKTENRSITTRADKLSSDRFYLMRTPEGLEIENSGGIASHVTPSDEFADERFVANASIEVRVNGIPVVQKPVPERVTQAGSKPLDELLTGVRIQLYDTPPDGAMLGQGERIRSMNWENHILLDVHSWDYDSLRVSSVDELLPASPVYDLEVNEDYTGYYRLDEGDSFRIYTDNRTLYRGVANGSKLISP